jgi:hypothetical protein
VNGQALRRFFQPFGLLQQLLGSSIEQLARRRSHRFAPLQVKYLNAQRGFQLCYGVRNGGLTLIELLGGFGVATRIYHR